MNTHTQKTRKLRKKIATLLKLLAFSAIPLVAVSFVLNYQVVRGDTPSSAAVGGIAFLYPAVDFSHAMWIPDWVARGPNFGRRVHLTGYSNSHVVATATVTSFMHLGWQLQDYWFDGVETARVRGY